LLGSSRSLEQDKKYVKALLKLKVSSVPVLKEILKTVTRSLRDFLPSVTERQRNNTQGKPLKGRYAAHVLLQSMTESNPISSIKVMEFRALQPCPSCDSLQCLVRRVDNGCLRRGTGNPFASGRNPPAPKVLQEIAQKHQIILTTSQSAVRRPWTMWRATSSSSRIRRRQQKYGTTSRNTRR